MLWITTNIEAEAKVVLQALSYYVKKGLSKVQVQTDSLALKHILAGEWKVPWS